MLSYPCMQFVLKSNYKPKVIEPTNPLRGDEYEKKLVSKIRKACPMTKYLDDKFFLHASIDYRFGTAFTLQVAIVDEETYNVVSSNQARKIQNLAAEIHSFITQIIKTANDSNIEFLIFKYGEYIRVFENILYGAFYDLDKDCYIDPPKFEKEVLKFEDEVSMDTIYTNLQNYISNKLKPEG